MKRLKLAGLGIAGYLLIWPENVLGVALVLGLILGALATWEKVKAWRAKVGH